MCRYPFGHHEHGGRATYPNGTLRHGVAGSDSAVMTRTREMNDFWTHIVFQLRQPMTTVTGQVRRAQHLLDTDPDKANEVMDDVVAQIARIDRLLDDLHERVRGKPSPPTA